jgi:glycosyltransferase involved in cell wall biosynthesis
MEVTVLLTTYNHEKYIAQAMDSVLMQETSFDFDIVILEDCSTDATKDILLAYQKRHPDKIRLNLADRNQCSAKPFAEAIQTAPSRYIAILDGDDYWTSPKKLEKQVQFLEAHPDCTLCFHNALKIYEDDSRSPQLYTPPTQKRVSVLDDLWQQNFIAGCAAMLRREVLDDLPEWFYTMPYGDWPLYILCARHGQIGYIDEILGVYRIHHEGLWSRLDSIQKLEGLIAFYEVMNANLGFRFNDLVEPLVSARRKDLAIMRSVVAAAQRILPASAIVIVMSRVYEDLPPLVGQKVWAFPERSGKQMQRHFASGSDGSAEAPWIGARSMYEFRLYGGPAQDKPLASVTVTQERSALHWPLPNRELGENGAFIQASPNPVPTGNKYGRTAITWSTGDGSKGVIHVTTTNLQVSDPANDDEAIKQLETLKRKGGEFLLIRRELFPWLNDYGGLKEHLDHQHRIIQDDEICVIYDIRKRETESQPESQGTARAAL